MGVCQNAEFDPNSHCNTFIYYKGKRITFNKKVLKVTGKDDVCARWKNKELLASLEA